MKDYLDAMLCYAMFDTGVLTELVMLKRTCISVVNFLLTQRKHSTCC